MDTNGCRANLTMDQIQYLNSLSPKLKKCGHFLQTNYNFHLPSNLKIENETLAQSLVNEKQNNILAQDDGNLGHVLGAAAHINVKRELDLSRFHGYYDGGGNQDTETRGGCIVKVEMQDDPDPSPVPPHSPTVPPHCDTSVPPGHQHGTTGGMVPSDELKMVKSDVTVCDKPNAPTSRSLVTGEFTCYRCQSLFSTCRALKQHGRRCGRRGETKGYHACPRCSYTCQSASILKIHERVHSGDKPYGCTLCDYKSGQKNNVAKHALVHLQEKPHRCRFCDYSATQKNNLVIHERTHTGIKPYKCTHCDYRTVQKPNLDKHMYLHTDRKPYVCDLCPYRCVQKANLVKHRRRHDSQTVCVMPDRNMRMQ